MAGRGKGGAASSAGRWGNDAWEEQNWDAVRKQEQMKQDVLVKASGNSERIRQMVRETEVTRSIGSETLGVLDQQSGEPWRGVHCDVHWLGREMWFG